MVWLLVAGMAVGSSPFSRGAGEREVAAELARVVRAAAATAGESAVRVGEFTPVGTRTVNAGKSLELALADALGDFATKSDVDAAVVTGTYQFVPHPEGGSGRVVRVRARLLDRAGDQSNLPETEGYVADAADLARYAGANVRLRHTDEPAARRQAVTISVPELAKRAGLAPGPAPAVSGGTRLALDGGDRERFGLEVRVAGAARPLSLDGSVPFVELNRGETYEIRLINCTPRDAAVTLTIDGLDVFAFSETRVPLPGGGSRRPLWVVPATGETLVRGWHRDLATASRFTVVGYGEGAVSKVAQADRERVGVITAAFAPSDSLGGTLGGPKRLETGVGENVAAGSRLVAGTWGPVDTVLTVRYQR